MAGKVSKEDLESFVKQAQRAKQDFSKQVAKQAVESPSAKEMETTRRAMAGVLESVGRAYAQDPELRVKTDGERVAIGPLVLVWAEIDRAAADQSEFETLLGRLMKEMDAAATRRAKNARKKAILRRRGAVSPKSAGGGARWGSA